MSIAMVVVASASFACQLLELELELEPELEREFSESRSDLAERKGCSRQQIHQTATQSTQH